jgi:GntR family transcriptional regulator, transcriptional repressor for pyruvate dehydrogenase complex
MKDSAVPSQTDETTRTQATAAAILRQIAAEGLRAGDRLPSEAALRERFGVSRIVLREALSTLKGLGIIESRRGSGARIAEIDFVDVVRRVLEQIAAFSQSGLEEVYALRRILELGSIDLAVARATEAEIRTLREMAGRMEALSHTPGAPLATFRRLDLEFHEAACRPAGCRLLDILNRILYGHAVELDASRMGGQTVGDRTTLERTNSEHAVLVEAFGQRNPEIALACLRRHLEHYDPVSTAKSGS